MPCREENRLREVYEAALRAWKFGRLRMFDGGPHPGWSRLRKTLVAARLEAATHLYNHSVSCEECRMSRQRDTSGGESPPVGQR